MVETCDLAVIGLGALGSATAWHAAGRGLRVVGIEAYELGHDRGASHDTSRIIRHSYHTPGYVALTFGAYDEWHRLEQDTGQRFVTKTGGVDLFPPDAAIAIDDYTSSLATLGIGFEKLDVAAVHERWPQFALPEGTVALYQSRTGIVPAAAGTAAMVRRARELGATVHDNTRVDAILPGSDSVELVTTAGVVSAGRVVVTADAWTAGLLAPLGVDVPLTVTEEQLTYFAPPRPERFAPAVFPVWIWMDDPSYYGFPTYGAADRAGASVEKTIKAAQDCGGPTVTAEDRHGTTDEAMLARLTAFLSALLPGCGPPVRSKRCLYTLTPDRDFVIDRLPAYPAVTVGLGSAHGFKFAPLFGRLLTDMALNGASDYDLSGFRLEREALTEPGYLANWLV